MGNGAAGDGPLVTSAVPRLPIRRAACSVTDDPIDGQSVVQYVAAVGQGQFPGDPDFGVAIGFPLRSEGASHDVVSGHAGRPEIEEVAALHAEDGAILPGAHPVVPVQFQQPVQRMSQLFVDMVGPIPDTTFVRIVRWKAKTGGRKPMHAWGQFHAASGEDIKFAIAVALQRPFRSRRNLERQPRAE